MRPTIPWLHNNPYAQYQTNVKLPPWMPEAESAAAHPCQSGEPCACGGKCGGPKAQNPAAWPQAVAQTAIRHEPVALDTIVASLSDTQWAAIDKMGMRLAQALATNLFESAARESPSDIIAYGGQEFVTAVEYAVASRRLEGLTALFQTDQPRAVLQRLVHLQPILPKISLPVSASLAWGGLAGGTGLSASLLILIALAVLCKNGSLVCGWLTATLGCPSCKGQNCIGKCDGECPPCPKTTPHATSVPGGCPPNPAITIEQICGKKMEACYFGCNENNVAGLPVTHYWGPWSSQPYGDTHYIMCGTKNCPK